MNEYDRDEYWKNYYSSMTEGQIIDMEYYELELSVRASNVCDGMNVKTIGDLANKTKKEIANMPNCGKVSLNEIIEALRLTGLQNVRCLDKIPRKPSKIKKCYSKKLTPEEVKKIVYTVEYAALRLGITKMTIYRGVERGEIPHKRIGRRILIPVSWVDNDFNN